MITRDNPIKGILVAGAVMAVVLAAPAALVAGCATADISQPAFAPAGTNLVPRAALVVSVSRVDPTHWAGWSGDCPGADADATSVIAALDAREIPYIHLADEAATRAGVEAAARAVCGKVRTGGLMMVYFSGHGGQVEAFGSEADDLDETLCLYDGRLLDDTVWSWLRDVPDGVRVWLVTDCCNSGTNYRGAPHDYANGVRAWWRREPDMLHWGAAQDGQRAIGSSAGGFFTIALRKAYKPGMTYRDWMKAAKPLVQGKQRPAANYTGTDFSDREAFR